jgi:spoIIIJ-associated protein
MSDEFHGEVRQFVAEVVEAMGLDVQVVVDRLDDGSVRVDIQGDEGELLLRRKGEALEALQHIVSTAYRRELEGQQRIVVDCLDFRRSKDIELQQMARFLIERAKMSGAAQELGPLNSYARRIVHMEVANDPEVTSESQGDGLVKRVIIAPRGK